MSFLVEQQMVILAFEATNPYRTHPNRFGMYELRERKLGPVDYGVTFQME